VVFRDAKRPTTLFANDVGHQIGFINSKKQCKMAQKKFTNKQQKFIQKFVDMLYYNMAIENEAPYSKREFFNRYKHHAVDLIRDGTYKKIKF
jgi:hypothetical protein